MLKNPFLNTAFLFGICLSNKVIKYLDTKK